MPQLQYERLEAIYLITLTMEFEQVKPGDWERFFIGEVPLVFYIEIILRVVLLYLVLIAAMRITGKRMAAQMDRIELAGLVTLAAAIGVPLQSPERGLLPAVTIAIVVVAVGRIVGRLSFNAQKIEKMSHGDISTLLEGGVVNMQKMEESLVTRQSLFAHLRSMGILQLGQLERVYFEAGGSFSMIRAAKERPGLCILPPWDDEFISELEVADLKVCCNCGKTEKSASAQCSVCKAEDWADARILSGKDQMA